MNYFERIMSYSGRDSESPASLLQLLDSHNAEIIAQYLESDLYQILETDPESFLVNTQEFFREEIRQEHVFYSDGINTIPINAAEDKEYTDYLHTIHLRLSISAKSLSHSLSNPKHTKDQWVLSRPITPHLITVIEILDEQGDFVETRIVHMVADSSAWKHDGLFRFQSSVGPPGTSAPPQDPHIETNPYTLNSRRTSHDYTLRAAVARNFQYKVGKAFVYLIPAADKAVLKPFESYLTATLKKRLSREWPQRPASRPPPLGDLLSGAIAAKSVQQVSKLLLALFEQLELKYGTKEDLKKPVLIPLTNFVKAGKKSAKRLIPNVQYKKPVSDLKFGTGKRLWAQGKTHRTFKLAETLGQLYLRKGHNPHTGSIRKLDIKVNYTIDVRYSFRRIEVKAG